METIYIVETRRSETGSPQTMRSVISFSKYEEALQEVRNQTAQIRKNYERFKRIHNGAAVDNMYLNWCYRYYLEFISDFDEIIRYEFTITKSELK